MAFKFKLGAHARDTFTGFSGRIVARIDYLTGCQKYNLLRSKVDKEGIEVTLWVDEYRLTEPGKKKAVAKKRPSGPAPKSLPTFDKP